jgi:chromosome partitioning protein
MPAVGSFLTILELNTFSFAYQWFRKTRQLRDPHNRATNLEYSRIKAVVREVALYSGALLCTPFKATSIGNPMAVITVFNQKGGVGKTTTALNVSAGLSMLNLDPIAIDLDPQGHLTLASGAPAIAPKAGAFGFFDGGIPLDQVVHRLESGRRIVPATLDLSKIDALCGGDANISTKLRDGIRSALGSDNAPVIIDCCPMLGVLTLNALIAADRVLIPVSADFLSLQGVDRLDRALNALEIKLKRRIERRVLVTRYDSRRRLSAEIYAELKRRYGDAVCETRIVENVSLAESPMRGKDIYAFAPSSPGARDYAALMRELGTDGFFN